MPWDGRFVPAAAAGVGGGSPSPTGKEVWLSLDGALCPSPRSSSAPPQAAASLYTRREPEVD